jgi:hypothetical protein
VDGLVEAGPVDPRQPPMTLAQMTKKRFGVDDLSRADQRLPPAGLARHGMRVGDVLVACQRMADEHGVGTRLVQFAIGLVGDLEGREIDAGLELQRLVRSEAQHEARRIGSLFM